MPEVIDIHLGQPGMFDKAVHCGTPQADVISIITKDHAMSSGASGAVISFKAEVDGKIVPVQATTSTKLLLGALYALKGRYDMDGRLLPHHTSDGSENER